MALPNLKISLKIHAFIACACTRSLLFILWKICENIKYEIQNISSIIYLKKEQKNVKIFHTDNQLVTKKVHFLVHFFAKIFGGFKKLLYLCTRF